MSEQNNKKPIVPAMYEDDVRELLERIQDEFPMSNKLGRIITRHALNIMQENKKNQEALSPNPSPSIDQ